MTVNKNKSECKKKRKGWRNMEMNCDYENNQMNVFSLEKEVNSGYDKKE